MKTRFSTVSRLWLTALLLSLFLLLPAVAAAETLQNIPANRIHIQPIEGLVYTDNSEDGLATILIDSNATNWQKVLLHSGASDGVQLFCRVDGPEWATQHASITGNAWETDEEMVQELKYGDLNYSSNSGVSRQIAAYTEEKDLLSPVKTNGGGNRFVHAIRWSDGNGRELFEVMEIDYRHTSMLGRLVELPVVDSDRIVPNANNVPGVKVTIDGGHVTYTCDPDVVEASGMEWIETHIKAPAGAARLGALSEFGSTTGSMVVDGYANVGVQLTDWMTGELLTGTNTERLSLIWYDDQDRIVEESGTFKLTRVNEKVNEHWMYYVQQDVENGVIPNAVPWKPAKITKDNVLIGYERDQVLVDSPYFETTVDADTAHVHISLKKDLDITVSMAQEISWCDVTYEVQPPAGAVAMTCDRYTRNNYYGRRSGMYEQHTESLLREEPIPLEQSGPIYHSNGMFRRLNTPIKDVVLYSMGLETKEDRGGTYLFCWFDKDGKPIEISYIAETADHFILEPHTTTCKSESEIAGPVKGPVFIDDQNTGWKLRSEYHVQEGSNAYIVELYLEDENGQPVHDFGGKSFVFYLPYREHEDFDQYDFYLMHYEDGDLSEGRNVNVTKTENGIRFEVDSLSPFVVSWGEEEGGGEGGDSFLLKTDNPYQKAFVEWELREPTPMLQEAAQLMTAEDIRNKLEQAMIEKLPDVNQIEFFEMVPILQLNEQEWWEIEDPDEFTDDGLWVFLPFEQYGIATDADKYCFLHMLGWDRSDDPSEWAGTIEVLDCRMEEDGAWLFFESMSPIAIGWSGGQAGGDEDDPILLDTSKSPEGLFVFAEVGVADPTAAMQANGVKDQEDIVKKLLQKLKAELPGVEYAAAMELTLMRAGEDGWETVEPDEFPEDGLWTFIPLADFGIDPDAGAYRFVHMLSYDRPDDPAWKAGMIETLDYRLANDGVWLFFESMSPVAIGWQYEAVSEGEPPVEAPAEPPKTGDSMPLGWLYVLLAASAAGAIALLIGKKRVW